MFCTGHDRSVSRIFKDFLKSMWRDPASRGVAKKSPVAPPFKKLL